MHIKGPPYYAVCLVIFVGLVLMTEATSVRTILGAFAAFLWAWTLSVAM